MNRILVTGASGFVGRNYLIASPKEWEITATYRRSEDFPSFLQSHGLTHVTPVRCDLADMDSVRQLCSQQGQTFDHCLYLAANTSIPLSVEQPLTDLRSSTVALLNVLERFEFGRFVYMSSGAVYDGLSGLVDPSIALQPRIPYAIAKLASEQYTKFFRDRRNTIENYVVLRFFGAFGPYEPARKIYTKLVRALALERRGKFTITGDGRNYIDAMYISDAIEGITRVLASDISDVIVDFASGSPMTIDSLAERAGKVFEVPVEIVHEGHTEEYIGFWVDTGPMEDLFGFRPSVSLEDGLMQLRDFLKAESQANTL